MQWHIRSAALIALVFLGFSWRLASYAMDVPVSVTLGHSIEALNGPWRFHLGDDPSWADTQLDDSDWEQTDMTPEPGAHDSDVGLTGYVPGWSSRGHAGYTGYAWYRLKLLISAPADMALALAGPADVDSAYQVFFNGQLLGGVGNFSTAVPTVYSIQPRVFPLPARTGVSRDSNVIAFRVWMGADTADASPDMGGIHIAPAIGQQAAVEALYRAQWAQTIRGYVVDLLEPIVFALLAVMSWLVGMVDRTNAIVYRWLIAGLLLTAAVRLNQVVYYWTQWESIHAFDWVRNGILIPLGLAAWTMACYAYLNRGHSRRIPVLIATLTLTYLSCQILTRSSMPGHFPGALSGAAQAFSAFLRLSFLVLLAVIVWRALRDHAAGVWLVLPAIVLLATGQFAGELSAIGVPGIWFPWGTGVSRTQYAYALFSAMLFLLLLGQFARTTRSRVASA